MTLNKNYIIIFLNSALVVILIFGFINHEKFKNEKQYLELEIGKLNKEKDLNLFNKKIECERYFNLVKEEYEETFREDAQRKSGYHSLVTKVFLFTFYSPKENSCLYVVEQEFTGEYKEFFIYNALTKSTITSFQYSDQFDEYKDFILEYSNGEVRL
jgi:hypothetical protein